MALTKSRTSDYSAQTLTAGAADTTLTGVDLTASYETLVDIKLTNGGTGPTIPAQVQVQIAADSGGTLWANYGGPLVAGVTNSAVYSWSITLPLAAGAFRTVAGSNTAQNVTLDVDHSRVTAI